MEAAQDAPNVAARLVIGNRLDPLVVIGFFWERPARNSLGPSVVTRNRRRQPAVESITELREIMRSQVDVGPGLKKVFRIKNLLSLSPLADKMSTTALLMSLQLK